MSSLADIQFQFETTSYEILELIGEGGMGAAYLGRHRRLKRRVAIKVLKTHYGGNQKDRFRLEAQASASLQHDNIVNVTDCGSLPNTNPYLVMELLEGHSLKELLEQSGGHLPVKRACEITRQILAGLGYAHEKGLIHRDIKPANIFICHSGRVKILDFGVAKMTEPLTGIAPLQAPTAEGAVVGTPRYLSPEQARGGDVDGRADLYAVGLVLYRMLTGVVPFSEHKTVTDLLLARCRTMPPPPSSHAPQKISDRLDKLVLRALAIDQSQRFKDAYEMAGAIIQLGTAYQQIAAQFGLDEVEWDGGPDQPATVRMAAASSPQPPSVQLSNVQPPVSGATVISAGSPVAEPTVLGQPAHPLSPAPAFSEGPASREAPSRFPMKTYVDSLMLSFFLTVVLGVTIGVLW